MALEKHFAQEWKSISAVAVEPANTSGCFECNICLDSARDPVVTLCGHLYCWPCIYKWFNFQSASLASDKHPQCPVCKAEISHSTVVPLYGRGLSPSEAELDIKAMAIPPRPPACGTKALMTTCQPGQQFSYHDPNENQQYSSHPYGSDDEIPSPSSFSLSGSSTPGSGHPVAAGMFGEMVYARVFGNSENLYSYPNSYHVTGSTSPRLRRQEMESDKSLNRVTIFLFFCFLTCLLLF